MTKNTFAGEKSALKAGRTSRRGARPLIYFWCVVAFYCCYMLLYQAEWVLGGEFWAETALTYLDYDPRRWDFQLFAQDGGHITIPLRLIALVAHYGRLKAAAIPYFYTWTAIVFTAMIVGAFCLARFRALLPSDTLRFAVSLFVLIVADFETRTFIGFPYFGVFFCSAVTALALSRDSDDAPPWAWAAPLILMSRTYSLAVVPAMACAMLFVKRRYAYIFSVCVAAGTIQFVNMAIRAAMGERASHWPENVTFFSKVLATFGYFFGLLGGYLIGPTWNTPLAQISVYLPIAIGVLLFVLLLALSARRHSASPLIWVGASTLLFSCLISTFAITADWRTDFSRLFGLPIYRHSLPGFYGCILMLAGALQIAIDRWPGAILARWRFGTVVPVGLFVIWALGSGWLARGTTISTPSTYPIIGNSNWQQLAGASDSGFLPLCVPIDPYKWLYGRNCRWLVDPPDWDWSPTNRLRFSISLPAGERMQIKAPDQVINANVAAIGVAVKPAAPLRQFIKLTVKAETETGQLVSFVGGRNVPPGGSLVLLMSPEAPSGTRKVTSVLLESDTPVMLLTDTGSGKASPLLMWMGN
jgi:hypothetical protein